MPQAQRQIARRHRVDRRITGLVVLCLWTSLSPDALAQRQRRVRRTVRKATATVTAVGARTGPLTAASVQFVTDKRAYLNRGARDGLMVKQVVSVSRGRRAAGTCVIETLADHQSTCTGSRLRVGDNIRWSSATETKTRPPKVPVLPPLVDEVTLRQRAVAFGEASYDKVDFSGKRSLVSHARISLSPGFTIWQSAPDARGSYLSQELSGAVQVYDLGATGTDFAAAFTAARWGGRTDSGRYLPNSPTQFYLWEAEISRRQSDANTVFAAGRIWPWHAPGLTLLDGFQIGRRSEDRSIEAGVYGGVIPWALNVAPSIAGWATGAYGALAQTGNSRTGFRLARQEARAGVESVPGAGIVANGEALAQVWVGTWNFGGGARALWASTVSPRPLLDRAYLDLGSRPTNRFGAGLHLRYIGSALPIQGVLRGETPALNGNLHALADAHWDASSLLGVAGYAGFNQDRQTGRGITHVGGETRFPRLLRSVGGLSLGAEWQEGWMRARWIYAQIIARWFDRVQFLARLSGGMTQFATPSTAPNVDEVGAYVRADGTIRSWLRLRLWSSVRAPVRIQNSLPVEVSYGVVAGLSLTGTF